MADSADLVIYVVDNENLVDRKDEEILRKIKDKKLIIFVNKNDLIDKKLVIDYINPCSIVYGNTINSNGLDALKDKIKELFNIGEIEESNYTFLSNARQVSLIREASNYIENIINLIDSLPLDVFSIDLNNAYELLGEIIGETYKDDLLDELFAKFCLGK